MSITPSKPKSSPKKALKRDKSPVDRSLVKLKDNYKFNYQTLQQKYFDCKNEVLQLKMVTSEKQQEILKLQKYKELFGLQEFKIKELNAQLKKGKRVAAANLMDFSTRRSNEGDNEDCVLNFKRPSRNTGSKFSTIVSNRSHFNKT